MSDHPPTESNADRPEAFVEREIEIVNRQGLHARPVMKIVDLAARFACRIHVTHGDRTADASSAMEMLLLEAPFGTRLTVRAVGKDAAAAVEAIAKLVAERFHED